MASADEIEAFGERLKSFRKQNGLTRQALAERVGCSRGYVSSLEAGSFSPSMSVLRGLSKALKVKVHELVFLPGRGDPDAMRVLNSPDKPHLLVPREPLDADTAVGEAIIVPGVMGRQAFAVYVPDDSMAPEFGKGDLVVFSLARQPADGDACLVDMGKGQVLFRTVLALPRAWRLQPSNPRFEPLVIKATKAVRMWPAIGRWQRLHRAGRR